MRPMSVRPANSVDLRRRLERLDGLPIRPLTARALIDTPVGEDSNSAVALVSPGNLAPMISIQAGRSPRFEARRRRW